ncbi:MAG TPA: hypothetical protein VEL31_12070 [Ktedonobacteraceae bacterium]|nr:hypothetical protein [Ktedonobacteraceae bacterium]
MVTESTDPTPTGLVVIARDTTGQIIIRITSHRDLVGAMNTAQRVLRLKRDAVRVEVHHQDLPTSHYPQKPLAAISRDDLSVGQVR